MQNFLEQFTSSLNIFDVIFFIIMAHSIFQCFVKGFSLSFFSFMKWVLALIITIMLVPKFQPWVSEHIESEFINNIGLKALVFLCSLFVTILIARSLNKVMTWSGLGLIDKYFGLIFGLFRGYVVSISFFLIFNWFYPYQNWGISAEDALSFDIVKKGSEVVIEEFPENQDFLNTKEKIEEI